MIGYSETLVEHWLETFDDDHDWNYFHFVIKMLNSNLSLMKQQNNTEINLLSVDHLCLISLILEKFKLIFSHLKNELMSIRLFFVFCFVILFHRDGFDLLLQQRQLIISISISFLYDLLIDHRSINHSLIDKDNKDDDSIFNIIFKTIQVNRI